MLLRALVNPLGIKSTWRQNFGLLFGYSKHSSKYLPKQQPFQQLSNMSNYEPSSDISDAYVENVASNKTVLKKPASKKNSEKPVEEVYQKKTQLEHILLRPDTYIGSVERIEQQMWVYDDQQQCMIQKQLSFVPGFFKIFDEILVNAADNKVRDPNMDTLKVDIDSEANTISIYNNGRGIPIVVHSKEGVYVPELIFGHLLTSSNYDDSTKKVTGGRNGYGAKLCNIFSTEFIIETADSESGKKYKQVFKKNMSQKSEPTITSWTKEDFTKITFKPDLAKFGMPSMDQDIVSLFKKRVYDMAGVCKDVKVFLNGERIKIKSFKQYVEMYTKKHAPEESVSTEVSSQTTSPSTIVYEAAGERWEVCCTVSDGQFQQVSFVNSINTYKGGTHVNHVIDQIVTEVINAAAKKNKTLPLKPFQVKNHIFVFINCQIENPAFDSQTKENMTLQVNAFGSKCKLSEDFMKKVIKSGVLDNVLNWAKFKQDQQLKKTDGTKRSRLAGIPKLDDANMAGTKTASKCTLILTEGDSAKALAVSGLSVIGRDYFGIFPLRGKLLNVRDASHKSIMDNAEISALKQILGLQQGKVYTSVDSLRYGRIMIMTDQDHDGSHIKGLIINFLDHFWPSLLRIPGFLTEFITPIVKCTKGRQEVSFFTLPEYEQWKAEHEDGKGWNIKYYKGLGTSTSADAKKYFSDMKTHLKEFSVVSDQERQLINMAFSKKMADDRKDWLKEFQPGTFMDHSTERISLQDFVQKELILFSIADNARSIPSVVDGLKPGHRKILFSCFKRKLKGEIKVAQLAGYIGEHSAYHHGEQSLCATIVGMAQDFVGSNNINLLEPIGQFGTRLQGGKDAASPRYIFTSLSQFARLLYRQEDDSVLKYLNDDGQSIEPEWYLPIIPMVLVNGGEGIGTGWSTFIPNYNPKDISRNIRNLLEDRPLTKMHPWYKGFKGTIEVISDDKYRVSGKWRVIDDSTLEVTELPIGTWTQNFKEYLETLLNGDDKNQPFIRDYREYHTETSVRFVISMTPENLSIAESEGIEKKFKLSTTISTSNLVCFDVNGRIKRYANPEKIIEDFFDVRLEYYQKRKDWLSEQLNLEWSRLDNRCRFITEIVNGTLVVHKRKKADIVSDLRARGYATFRNESPVVSEDEHYESVTDFDYLLSMPIYSLTMERVELLQAEKEAKEAELNALLKKSAKDLWRDDLDSFENLWNEDTSHSMIVDERPPSAKRPTAKTSATTRKTEKPTQTVKPAVTKKLKTQSSQEPIAATPSDVATKKQATMDMFSKPISSVSSINDDELPLAEHINRMLASRMAAASNKATLPQKEVKAAPIAVVPDRSEPPQVAKQTRARPSTQKRKTFTVSSEEEEEVDDDDDEYSNNEESDDMYSE